MNINNQKVNLDDNVDKLFNDATKYFISKGYDVIEGSNSNSDYGHSRYFYVNQDNRIDEHLGLGLQVRVSDHSVTSNRRMLSEHLIFVKEDIGKIFHKFNFYFHPEEYKLEKKVIIKESFPFEVGEKNLRPTDKVLSERKGKKGMVYQIKRYEEVDGVVPTHIESGYKMPFKPNNPDIRFDGGGMTYREYVNTQFDENEDRYLPSGYLGEFEIKQADRSNYPILIIEKNGLEYRIKNNDDSVIVVFDDEKQVAYADNKAIMVAPTYQKRGIGLELVRILKERNPSHRFGSMTPEGFNLLGKYYDTYIQNNPDIRYAKGGSLPNSLHIVIEDVNPEKKYFGGYKKIFDIIEEDVALYNPYGTEREEMIGNDFHIWVSPIPDIDKIEKIKKLKGVKVLSNSYAKGGSVKRYNKENMNKVKKGGITYGNSHAEGGIKVKNASTGDMLEVEGGEGIVNKRSMASDRKVVLNGKEMTICQAVSNLNQIEGGVQFNCDDVSDRQFIEEMALGGELERGTRTEKEHIQVLKDLYAKRITPAQATKRIAKDHLKEDRRYYSKLAKMEGKMAKGGKIADVDNLEGSIVKIYDAGVKDPIFFVVKSAKMSDPNFRYKTLTLTSQDGYVEEIQDENIEDFLIGKQIQMKTKGKNDFYALQLTHKKMKLKNGGKTEDCGCGLTYADGGFVEDKTPMSEGQIVYLIEPNKPKDEWLRGVLLELKKGNAKVLITDKNATQFEKVVSQDTLIKMELAQSNPADFKQFTEQFNTAKDNYYQTISALGIIEEKIKTATKYPNNNPEKQKEIIENLKNELSLAKKMSGQSASNFSKLDNVPSAFYRYGKGGMVTIDKVQSVFEPLVKEKVFDLGYIKLNTKKLGEDFSTIRLTDLSVPVTDRDKWVARYSYSIKDIPTTKVVFQYFAQDNIYLSFSIATRNLQNKSINWADVNLILYKLGFNVSADNLDFSIINESKSKKFNFYFRKNYYNLFKSNTALADLLEYFKVFSLMLILPFPFQGLEKRDGQTINNMREVFENGEIETNIEEQSGQGSSQGNDDLIELKINKFLETYDEQKESPQYFKPKTGESEAKGILRTLAQGRFISKDAWEECVERNKLLDDLAEKVKDLPTDAILYKVLMPKIIENANILYQIGRELSIQWEKTLNEKMSDGEKRDFPILMMKIWQHKQPLDSSIFE